MEDTCFLVIGASGLIGRCLLRTLGPDRAVGTYASRPFPGGVPFDLARNRLRDWLPVNHSFTHALVAGAMTAIDACAADPEASARINVDGVRRVLDDLLAAGIHPIFTSSDAVYPGTRAMSGEDDEVRPVLTYGRQKLAVEEHLARCSEPWTVVRLAKVLDPEGAPGGVLGPWIGDLVAERTLRCAVDQWFTPVGVDDVVAALLHLAADGVQGVFNLAGPQRVSRIGLLRLLAHAVGRRCPFTPRIEPCSIRDFPFAEARPLDGSMSIERLRAAIPFEPEDMATLCRRAAATLPGQGRNNTVGGGA
jgi:dTDP-4-dehydrorhamnose reductase